MNTVITVYNIIEDDYPMKAFGAYPSTAPLLYSSAYNPPDVATPLSSVIGAASFLLIIANSVK